MEILVYTLIYLAIGVAIRIPASMLFLFMVDYARELKLEETDSIEMLYKQSLGAHPVAKFFAATLWLLLVLYCLFMIFVIVLVKLVTLIGKVIP
jgi:hypothetical protein